jgi:hypothetical protein
VMFDRLAVVTTDKTQAKPNEAMLVILAKKGFGNHRMPD